MSVVSQRNMLQELQITTCQILQELGKSWYKDVRGATEKPVTIILILQNILKTYAIVEMSNGSSECAHEACRQY